MLNFIAIDLQLYKIFKIMRVSFFGTFSIRTFWHLYRQGTEWFSTNISEMAQHRPQLLWNAN